MARFNFGGGGYSAPPGRGFTFNMGADPALADLLYNHQSWEKMFPQAWQQIVDSLGGSPDSSYARWLQGWQNQAKLAYGEAAMNTGRSKDDQGNDVYNLKVTDFLNRYAPRVASIYRNQSAASRGEDLRLTGRPRMLG